MREQLEQKVRATATYRANCWLEQHRQRGCFFWKESDILLQKRAKEQATIAYHDMAEYHPLFVEVFCQVYRKGSGIEEIVQSALF